MNTSGSAGAAAEQQRGWALQGVPQYKRAATALDGLVEFGAVNCDKHNPLCR